MKKKSAESSLQDDPRYLTSVERGFQVLEAFSEQLDPLSLSDLARETSIGIPTLQRLTATLVEAGYLTKSAATRRYQPTLKTINLLYSYLSRNRFAHYAWPHLLGLREELKMDVSLSVRRGASMIYVHRLPGHRGSYENTLSGRQIPMHCSASGRCYLGVLPDADVDAYFLDCKPEVLTPQTLIDVSGIRAEIALGRKRGYCVVSQEVTLGVVTLACPVVRHGLPVAGVSVHAPYAAISAEALAEAAVPALAATANAISAS